MPSVNGGIAFLDYSSTIIYRYFLSLVFLEVSDKVVYQLYPFCASSYLCLLRINF